MRVLSIVHGIILSGFANKVIHTFAEEFPFFSELVEVEFLFLDFDSSIVFALHVAATLEEIRESLSDIYQ